MFLLPLSSTSPYCTQLASNGPLFSHAYVHPLEQITGFVLNPLHPSDSLVAVPDRHLLKNTNSIRGPATKHHRELALERGIFSS